jgi:hypothetical protein
VNLLVRKIIYDYMYPVDLENNKRSCEYSAIVVPTSKDIAGADPGFQVRGGALKKIAPSGGGHEHFWGISCEKSRFYAKKSNVFQLRREARKVLGISCEKSRFYAKKSYFFQF